MAYYRRRTLEWWEELAAVAAGTAAGLTAGYLARIWLRREPAGGRPPRRPDRGAGEGAGRGEASAPDGERRAGAAEGDARR